jgi:hypothetical protein
MLTFAAKYARNVYSQNGEDGIIEECINRIQPFFKTAVEIGAPSWNFCSNTAYLYDKGWNVEMYDINPNDSRIIALEVTPENVFHTCFTLPDVLSIDIDNNDYHIWKALNYQAPIVIIEINSSIPPNIDEIPGDRGASYKSMVELGIDKGYFLLCHTGNLIFILNKYKELFPEVTGDGLSNYHDYFNTSFL